MKQNLITDVIQGMLPYLNNAQTERLQEVLQHTLFDYEVTKTEKDKELSEQNLVESFLSAKRIEGCSEKTLKYYKATIQSMKILVPPTEVIEDFQHKFDIFNEQIEANTIEIQRLYELQSVLLAKLAY